MDMEELLSLYKHIDAGFKGEVDLPELSEKQLRQFRRDGRDGLNDAERLAIWQHHLVSGMFCERQQVGYWKVYVNGEVGELQRRLDGYHTRILGKFACHRFHDMNRILEWFIEQVQ